MIPRRHMQSTPITSDRSGIRNKAQFSYLNKKLKIHIPVRPLQNIVTNFNQNVIHPLTPVSSWNISKKFYMKIKKDKTVVTNNYYLQSQELY